MSGAKTKATRHWLLGGALVLTLVAVVFAPAKPDDDGVVQAAPHAARATRDSGAAPASDSNRAASTDTDDQLTVLALAPRTAAKADAALFVAEAPPKPVVVAAPVAAGPTLPVEPPLPPYKVIGSYLSEGSHLVLLIDGKDTLEVQQGDTVANGWRVKSVTDDSIVFASPSGQEHLLPVLQSEDGH